MALEFADLAVVNPRPRSLWQRLAFLPVDLDYLVDDLAQLLENGPFVWPVATPEDQIRGSADEALVLSFMPWILSLRHPHRGPGKAWRHLRALPICDRFGQSPMDEVAMASTAATVHEAGTHELRDEIDEGRGMSDGRHTLTCGGCFRCPP